MKKVAIIGAGIFGVVSALEISQKFEVTLFDYNYDILQGASFINQARVHRGYHYPRSDETTVQCINNYSEFESYFSASIIKDFKQYYCIAKNGSKISSSEYLDFLNKHNLNYQIVNLSDSILNNSNIDLTLLVEEFAFDGESIRETLKKKVNDSNIRLVLNTRITNGEYLNGQFNVYYCDNESYESCENFDFVINATYSNINGINQRFGLNNINLSHQITEMVIVDAAEYSSIGITIMDGNFMSIMPFNRSGLSSISNVLLTPHETSNNALPIFKCNLSKEVDCEPSNLSFCNTCSLKPQSNYLKIISFTKNFLMFTDKIKYIKSMFTIKSIIINANDGRQSIVFIDDNPNFISILAGKVDTVFAIAREVSNHLDKLCKVDLNN